MEWGEKVYGMAELRNIKWTSFLKGLTQDGSLEALTKSHSLQWWLTRGFRKQGYILLDTQDLIGTVIEHNGVQFYPELLNYPRMFEAWYRYRLDLVQPEDTVFDLGANIGSFTLPAAQRCREVIAVEPIYNFRLEENVRLNKLEDKIEVIPYSILYEWVDCQEVKLKATPIDTTSRWNIENVVRIDIGGAEWELDPWVFYRTRQLEIEFHFVTKEQRKANKWSEWERMLEAYFRGCWTARWSKHKHWLYLSAHKEVPGLGEVQLVDGSFEGVNLNLWREVRPAKS